MGDISSVEEAVKLGISFEDQGRDFYLEFAESATDPAAKDMFLYLAEEEKTLSEVVNGLPRYKMIKEALKMKDINEGEKFLKKIKNTHKNKKLDFSDGIRLTEDDSWVHIRKSGTEPIFRIIAEAPTLKKAKQLVKLVKSKGAK